MIETLVVVDDREDGRQIASQVADFLDLRLQSFTHPAEALPVLLEMHEPFVMVLDHNFEDDDYPGWRLCNELRQQHPFGLILPIIYLSGFMRGEEFLSLLHNQLLYAPTAFVRKKDASAIAPMIRNVLRTFDAIQEAAEKQAATQALAHLAELL